MINKLYSILISGATAFDGGYYGKAREPITVPSTAEPIVRALVPIGTPGAMAFRASVLINLIRLYPGMWNMLREADPSNTYDGIPPYRDTKISCPGYSKPTVYKNKDCVEPAVSGTILGFTDHVLVTTNIGATLNVPYIDGLAHVSLPKSYTIVVPKSWDTSGVTPISFTIEGTPVKPEIKLSELMPYVSTIDSALYDLVDSGDKYSVTSALCIHLIRTVNG